VFATDTLPWLISFSLGLSALLLPLASAVFFESKIDQSRPSQLTSMLRAGADNF